jgi:hypothetical protein
VRAQLEAMHESVEQVRVHQRARAAHHALQLGFAAILEPRNRRRRARTTTAAAAFSA